MRSRFTDGTHFFKVDEVIQTGQGLIVYYYNEETEQQYTCLLDAFVERFREVQQDD